MSGKEMQVEEQLTQPSDEVGVGRRESLRWALLGTLAATGVLSMTGTAHAQQRITLASLQADINNLSGAIAELQADLLGPLSRVWPTLPSEYLDLVTVASISSNAGYGEHGPFRLWVELHANNPGTGSDYAWSIGMVGDGITTNKSFMTWETSYDTGGGWKTDEFYWTKQHPGSAWWPGTGRRIGPCFSTFSTNRGNIGNGTAIGHFNLDNVEFHSDQPSVNGSKAGWNYANFFNNFETGTAAFCLQSHSTNYSQFCLTVDSAGTSFNATNLNVICSGNSLQLTVGDVSLAVDAVNNVAALTGALLNITAPGDAGESPGLQIFHAGLFYGYQNMELRTKAANQVSGMGLWNFNTPAWSIQNRGDLNNRFAIYNVALDENALSIDASDNTLRFGNFTAASDTAIAGHVQIRTKDGTLRKLAVIN
jgi:hypothetical protein